MAVVLVFLGLIALLFALVKFVQIFLKLIKAGYFYFFASEKKMDTELINQWSKEPEYKAFEKQIPKEF